MAPRLRAARSDTHPARAATPATATAARIDRMVGLRSPPAVCDGGCIRDPPDPVNTQECDSCGTPRAPGTLGLMTAPHERGKAPGPVPPDQPPEDPLDLAGMLAAEAAVVEEAAKAAG